MTDEGNSLGGGESLGGGTRPPRGRGPRAILIAGPTASGKSALAVTLASRLRGQIINADSMQVYRDLAILTARPTPAAMAATPHELYGTIDGAITYSVQLWLADATAAIARAQQAGLIPILVGGTGLYFKALTEGLSEIPAVPDDVRAEIRAWAEGRPPEALHAELARRDPATAARLLPTDPQRIIRGLEVHAATGKALVYFQTRRAPPVLDPATVLAVSLTIERDILRERIDRRFDEMMVDGALDEVRRLAGRRFDPAQPIMRAIGVPPLRRHLDGQISLVPAIADAKTASRQYVKRQETFARHQLKSFRPVAANQAEAMLMSAYQSFE